MTNTLEMPFAIGQQMWEPVYTPQSVRVPCPVCDGKLFVTIIFGSGEPVTVECNACESGYHGARGYVDEWRYGPSAKPFVIAAVKSMYGNGDWTVENDAGNTYSFANLCATEAEAVAQAVAHEEEQMRRQCDLRQHKIKNARLMTMSAKYHRSCIRDLERKIAWHRGKLESRTPVPAVESTVGVTTG